MAKQKQPDASKKQDSKRAPKKAKQSAADSGEAAWSKSKKKRMRQRKGKQKKMDSQDKRVVHKKSGDRVNNTKSGKQKPLPTSSSSGTAAETSDLQKSFLARLTGSRFRELNEVRFYMYAGVNIVWDSFDILVLTISLALFLP